MTKKYSPYPFRMPDEMREEIESKAKDSGRSLQQEMLRRIDLSLNLEKLFGSRNPGIDAMYSFIAENWRSAHTAETRCSELEDEIAKLKEQNRVLAQSSNVSDDLRFMSIRRSAEVAAAAIIKIQSELPPIPEPIKKPT